MCIPLKQFHSSQTLVAIDARVNAEQWCVCEVVDDADVLFLRGDRDGIEQISTAIDQQGDVTSLHIIAQGTAGCLYLGNTELSLYTLDKYALHLMSWFLGVNSRPANLRSENLQPCASLATSLVLHSAEVAMGEVGLAFVHQLYELTGANVLVATEGIVALDAECELCKVKV